MATINHYAGEPVRDASMVLGSTADNSNYERKFQITGSIAEFIETQPLPTEEDAAKAAKIRCSKRQAFLNHLLPYRKTNPR